MQVWFNGRTSAFQAEYVGSIPITCSTISLRYQMREWLSWWSTTLPRSGSRVRVPSRALLNIERGYPLGYPLSILNESCRTRTGSYLRFASVGAKPTSTGRCAPRLASTLLHCRTRTFEVYVSLRSAHNQRPLDVVRRLALFYLCIECKNDVATAFCQFFTHHMHIFLQWYFFFVLI